MTLLFLAWLYLFVAIKLYLGTKCAIDSVTWPLALAYAAYGITEKEIITTKANRLAGRGQSGD